MGWFLQLLQQANNSGNALGPERAFHSYGYVPFVKWMQQNWTQSISYSVVYVILTFSGRSLMQNRKKFDLRLPLIIWNTLLAVFSILGTMRCLPELLLVLFQDGLTASVCDASYHQNPLTSLWGALFGLSKLWELGDTCFVVLRKQPLIFLHWYHHVTVMIYTFHSVAYLNGSGRWFMTMNYVVHSIMYSYYTLRALQVRVPKAVSMGITCIQLSQMFVGLFVLAYSYRVVYVGVPCTANRFALSSGVLMYISYAVLFANYFLRTYWRRGAKPPAVKQE